MSQFITQSIATFLLPSGRDREKARKRHLPSHRLIDGRQTWAAKSLHCEVLLLVIVILLNDFRVGYQLRPVDYQITVQWKHSLHNSSNSPNSISLVLLWKLRVVLLQLRHFLWTKSWRLRERRNQILIARIYERRPRSCKWGRRRQYVERELVKQKTLKIWGGSFTSLLCPLHFLLFHQRQLSIQVVFVIFYEHPFSDTHAPDLRTTPKYFFAQTLTK